MATTSELFEAIGEGDLDAARAALEAGADVNGRRADDDMSPLRLAGRLCRPEMVALLAEHGADVGREGGDALLEAAVWGHLPTVEALVAAGVDPADAGVVAPALYEAQQARHAEVVDFLIGAGAGRSIGKLSYSPIIAEVMQLQLEPGALERFLAEGVDPDDTTAHGETALMFAAARGHGDAIDTLLGAGADPTMVDDWGRSAAIRAAEAHHLELGARLARAALDGAEDVPRRARTRLDDVDTPLRRRPGRELVVLYPMGRGAEGIGRCRVLGAAGSRAAALQIVSDDNSHRQTQGPYLVCERLATSDDLDPRPTDPLARPAGALEASPGAVLVLAHTPTTPADVGAPIAAHRARDGFWGWAVIADVFGDGGEKQARRRAAERPGRSEAVRLLDVCTCTEGWVEAFERLAPDGNSLEAAGASRQVWPQPAEPSGDPAPSAGPGSAATTAQPGDDNVASPRSGGPPRASDVDPGPRPSAPRFDPLSPMRIMGKAFDVFRAYPAGFLGFGALLLLSVAATGRAALYFAEVRGLPLLAIHTLLALAAPAPLLAGFYRVVLGILRGNRPRFGDFLAGYRYLPRLAPVYVLGAVAVALPEIAFLRPLWLLAAYLKFALMYAVVAIVDRDVDALTAMVASWRLTHATLGDSLFVLIASLLTSFAGVAFFGVGIVATVPIGAAMIAVAYAEISDQKG